MPDQIETEDIYERPLKGRMPGQIISLISVSPPWLRTIRLSELLVWALVLRPHAAREHTKRKHSVTYATDAGLFVAVEFLGSYKPDLPEDRVPIGYPTLSELLSVFVRHDGFVRLARGSGWRAYRKIYLKQLSDLVQVYELVHWMVRAELNQRTDQISLTAAKRNLAKRYEARHEIATKSGQKPVKVGKKTESAFEALWQTYKLSAPLIYAAVRRLPRYGRHRRSMAYFVSLLHMGATNELWLTSFLGEAAFVADLLDRVAETNFAPHFSGVPRVCPDVQKFSSEEMAALDADDPRAPIKSAAYRPRLLRP